MITLMIGLPGSGKSTLAKTIQEKYKNDTIIISRDNIREMYYGSYQNYEFSEENEKFIQRTVITLLDLAILNDKNVIIDETNLTKEKREMWVNTFRCIGLKYSKSTKVVGIWVDTSVDVCKARRKLDTKNSDNNWDLVIDNMVLSFEEPKKSEFDELFMCDNGDKDV